MIKILLVDDDSEKLKKIKVVINKFTEIPEESVHTCLDLVGARKHLIENNYDLMILDINIPNRLGEANKLDGGAQFLNEIRESRRLNVPMNIIGLTSHEELLSKFEEVFSKDLWHIIQFENDTDTWAEKLYNKIEHLLKSEKFKIQSNGEEYKYDVAIVTALKDPELDAFLRNINAGWTEVNINNDPTVYYKGTFKSDDKVLNVIAACAPQMGMVASTLLSSKLINNFRPKYLIMGGIAAGIKGRGNFGDILIADQTWDYGNGKYKYIPEQDISVFEPDPKQVILDSRVREKLSKNYNAILFSIYDDWNGIKPETTLKLHIGPVASGAMVLADNKVIDDIKKMNRKIIGIEMETYGVYYSAANSTDPRPIALSMKSICDFGDHEKGDDYQKYAAYTSAKFIYEFALKEL